jgi:hypothetical protein
MGQLLAGRKPANVNWDKDLTEYAADAVALMADKTSKTL